MSSNCRQTAEKLVECYRTLDTTTMSSLLTDDYMHQQAPASVSTRNLNKKDHLEFFGSLTALLKGVSVTVKEYFVAENDKQVTIWMASDFEWKDEVKDEELSAEDWAYCGEYVMVLKMDETGNKILKALEFVDSKMTADILMPLIQRAMKNLTAKQAGASK
jgi:hypothetical protein